jgi:hypothetical protein
MEEVRAPMEFKQERLVDSFHELQKPTRRKYNLRRRKNTDVTTENSLNDDSQIAEAILNDDMERILIESQMEYVNLKMKEKEELQLEKEKRREIFDKFTNIRNQLKRIGKYDKDIQQVYELLIPMIDRYCEDTSVSISLDSETYHMILRNLKTIRLKKEDEELVHKMIQLE